MANNYPLLFFPEPMPLQKSPGNSFPPKIPHFPSHDRQKERLAPLFETLRRSFEAQRVSVQNAPAGIDPEQVLIFETVGNAESFLTAIRNTEGLEWMGEIELDDIQPSEDFHYVNGEEEKSLSGRLFLTMTNQRAMNEMLSLWQQYSDNPNVSFQRGLNGFKTLFKQLKDIRKWDVQDRLFETRVLEYWMQDMQANEENIRFELQLWFSKSSQKREDSFNNISEIINSLNGKCFAHSVIEAISYHGMLVELPANAIQEIIKTADTQLVKCNDIMFFRPSGQIAVGVDIDPDSFINTEHNIQEHPSGTPEAALLDGLPVSNHQTLANGRIIIDDPDNYSENYDVKHRVHGTSMSSLIVHGDLSDNESSIKTPLYVRPIMKPTISFNGAIERVPNDVLFVDLLHRAIKRIFEGDEDSAPIDTIKIINLSIGDDSLIFYHSMSPTAKLLDWLSWKYNVLFIVSAGNQLKQLELSTIYKDFKSLNDTQRESLIYNAIVSDVRNRRLLSPSETINNLTIGSVSIDNSKPLLYDRRINPTQRLLPNVYSAFGGGYKRSIKPDLVYYGGAQFFEEPFRENSPTPLIYSTHKRSPGNIVAAPSDDLNKTYHTRGTSNATALITRRGIQITDTLKELFQEDYNALQYRQYLPLLIKALLTHGCSWGEMENNIRQVLYGAYSNTDIKRIITNWVGYGLPDVSKVQECTNSRVTVLGFGELLQDQVHLFRLPLPSSLSGRPESRKLTITLAWFTPIASNTQKYRVAGLFFDSNNEIIGVSRDDADWQKVRKGTLQHEVFVGQQAVAFEDDGAILIRVTCRKDAEKFNYLIPYSIVVTLEVAEEVGIPIYQEVRDKLLTPIIVEQSSLF